MYSREGAGKVWVLGRQLCVEPGRGRAARRANCEIFSDGRTKISELRVRTGEGAGQKGAGLREEGHGAGSQGYVAATATCPSVNTYPGTCSHTHADALRA